MKSYGKYISRFLVSFIAIILLLLALNVLGFFWMFHNVVTDDYGETAPRSMLEKTAEASSAGGISSEMEEELRRNQIWAMFLSSEGKCLWQVDLPEGIPTSYTIQDVASFSKGYLHDYPVFVRTADTGLLVLGYPQNSYIKITGNYYSSDMLKIIPLFAVSAGVLDLTVIFFIYFLSKRKIVKSTEPIISSIEVLSNGKPTSLTVKGELSRVADSINKASQILSKQNQARANWISGVSHDIRTPLSMILGYAGRIASNKNADNTIREQAEIIEKQSLRIKELVKDLNLVSQLEYEMQPLHKESVRLSKLLRSYMAELLNTGIPDSYSIDIQISDDVENITLDCDARLISRAINNLVQNSIQHNPQGCEIQLTLKNADGLLTLIVADNGVGLTPEKLQELEAKPHYMESTDERLDLRHGLGLLLVRQIVEAHNGSMKIDTAPNQGYRAILSFRAISMKSI